MVDNTMIETLLDPDCSLDETSGVMRLVSNRFDDIYFSGEDGLAETKCVFLDGSGLPERWAGRDHFVIAETGFGTGLNFLAVMAEIERLGPAAPHVTYISTEIAPLDPAMIDRILAPWPELAHLRSMLVAVLPPRWPGRHRRHFLDGKVTLDLLYGDSVAVLDRFHFKADAWFLDGFTPARNPLMWNNKLYILIAERSMQGTTLGSFTAAGDVRRGLEAAGFTISRHPGFGGKRHRITGTFDPGAEDHKETPSPGRVAVIGGGIAGASVAASLKMRGVDPLLISAGNAPADGASGNIAAVQAPRLTATDTAEASLSLTAWGYARYCAETAGVSLNDATMILSHDEREKTRQQKIADLTWPQTVYRSMQPLEAALLTGLETGLGGMAFDHGGVVDPVAFVKDRLEGIDLMLNTRITSIEQHGRGFRLHHDQGCIEAETLVLAAGWGLPLITGASGLDDIRFQVTAGHVSHLNPSALPLTSGVSFGGYMARARDGTIALGASFDHHDPAKPLPELGRAQHEANMNLLPEPLRYQLKDQLGGSCDTWQGRTSLRLASPDRQPLAGAVSTGFYVLAGLGARGMVTAPILGEHIASLILGLPSPLNDDMAGVVAPGRFRKRADRRQSGSSARPSAE